MANDYDVLVIKDGIFESVFQKVVSRVENDRNGEDLYLVLDTSGGDPNKGFRIMQLLHARYKRIYVVIPDRAMSTGTMMSLGGDKIFMYPSSCLGPLDLQIEHPTDGSWISALDVRDTMNTLISHTEVAAKRLYDQTYNKIGLSKTAAAKIANKNAVELIKPIVNKIDPYHLHKSFRSAEVGANYGAILLQNRMLKGKRRLAEAVSSKLANDYESHGYAITLSEAEKILLSVSDLSNLKEWDEKVKDLYENQYIDVEYHCIKTAPNQTQKKSKNK